jgi:hypothetical protein
MKGGREGVLGIDFALQLEGSNWQNTSFQVKTSHPGHGKAHA